MSNDVTTPAPGGEPDVATQAPVGAGPVDSPSAALSQSNASVESSSVDGWWAEALTTVDAGGPVVILLLGLSVVALSVVLVKWMQFYRAQLHRGELARRALGCWQAGNGEAALALTDGTTNPIAQALARAIRGRLRQLPEPLVREEVLRYGSDALFQLRRGLRPLEVIGSMAPLLGLLGTVLGMISAFRQLEAAGNKVNPAILSGGIWEALLTTAVGLCVAIPVVAVLNWLERRVDHLAHDMNNLVTQVFTEDLSANTTENHTENIAENMTEKKGSASRAAPEATRKPSASSTDRYSQHATKSNGIAQADG